jgi:hypothetical protein
MSPNNRTFCAGLRAPLEARVPSQEVHVIEVLVERMARCLHDDERPCKMTQVSPHLTPPHLRTGESMHLVCFWPSPTSRARRERQRRASGSRLWVGTARFCVVQDGCFFPSCKIMTPVSPHSTPPHLRTGESMHLVCFWPSPTPRARRERQRRASGSRLWVGRARFCVCAGWVFFSLRVK